MDCNVKVMQNEDTSAVVMALCGIHNVTLEVMDLWVRLQGYYYFSTPEERVEIDQRGIGFAKRMKVSREVWKQGLKIFLKLGLIESNGRGFGRLLNGADAMTALEARVQNARELSVAVSGVVEKMAA